MFLSPLFLKYREIKRLLAEVKYWRERAESYEKDNRMLAAVMVRQNEAWADRFLTSQIKTHGISEEVRVKAAGATATDVEKESQLAQYLSVKKLELEQDAIEAGFPVADAHIRFEREKSDYIAEFKQSFGFNNA